MARSRRQLIVIVISRLECDKAAEEEERREDDCAAPEGPDDVDLTLLHAFVQRRRDGLGQGQLQPGKNLACEHGQLGKKKL